MIEINPRISTIVYQDDLNLPYLGVKRAIGEISDDELRALAAADPPRAGRRCATSTSSSSMPAEALSFRATSGDCPRTWLAETRLGTVPGHARVT